MQEIHKKSILEYEKAITVFYELFSKLNDLVYPFLYRRFTKSHTFKTWWEEKSKFFDIAGSNVFDTTKKPSKTLFPKQNRIYCINYFCLFINDFISLMDFFCPWVYILCYFINIWLNVRKLQKNFHLVLFSKQTIL